jgi:hypothetical protein
MPWLKDPANPLGPAALATVAGPRAVRLRSRRVSSPRRREPQEQAALTEDEAMERLYGQRTGTVSASTTRPPLGRR